MKRIVHYLNQFYGQIGGEEFADQEKGPDFSGINLLKPKEIKEFLFQNLRAEFDTVIADIYIICASDQFSNLILCLAAK